MYYYSPCFFSSIFLSFPRSFGLKQQQQRKYLLYIRLVLFVVCFFFLRTRTLCAHKFCVCAAPWAIKNPSLLSTLYIPPPASCSRVAYRYIYIYLPAALLGVTTSFSSARLKKKKKKNPKILFLFSFNIPVQAFLSLYLFLFVSPRY